MMKRYLSLLILPLLLAASCAPQAFVLNSEMRGPSKSGLDLAGKSMAVVYLCPQERDTLFASSVATGFVTRPEEDYFGGDTFIDIYRMPARAGVDYGVKDSLVALVMDTGKDVVFLFDTPELGAAEFTTEPARVSGQPAKSDSAYVASVQVPYKMKIYVYDSMGKEDKVFGFGGTQDIQQPVYMRLASKRPSGVALHDALAASAAKVGYKAADSFMSTWKEDAFYVVYYDGAEKAWDRGAENAYRYQWREAIEEWMTLLQSRNPEKKACASYNIALACFMLGQSDLALEWLDRSDKELPVSLSKRLREQIEKYRR